MERVTLCRKLLFFASLFFGESLRWSAHVTRQRPRLRSCSGETTAPHWRRVLHARNQCRIGLGNTTKPSALREAADGHCFHRGNAAGNNVSLRVCERNGVHAPYAQEDQRQARSEQDTYQRATVASDAVECPHRHNAWTRGGWMTATAPDHSLGRRTSSEFIKRRQDNQTVEDALSSGEELPRKGTNITAANYANSPCRDLGIESKRREPIFETIAIVRADRTGSSSTGQEAEVVLPIQTGRVGPQFHHAPV